MVAPTWLLMSSPTIGRPALAEALLPVGLAADEDRHAVHERAAGAQDLLDVPLGGVLGADRQVADDDVGVGVAEDPGDVGRGAVGLGDDLGEVLAEAVVGHAAVDLDAQVRHVGELDRVVRLGEDGLGEVLADLGGVDVERRGEVDVADVVAAEVHVHQAGDELVRVGVLVELDALHQGRGAVAHADDRYVDGVAHGRASPRIGVRSCTRTSFVFLHETMISVKSPPHGSPPDRIPPGRAPRARRTSAPASTSSAPRSTARPASAGGSLVARGGGRPLGPHAAAARACAPRWPPAAPGEAEGIVVARLDRLTYSLIDLAEIVREAVDGGFTIVSLAARRRPGVGRRPRGGGGARRGRDLAAARHHHAPGAPWRAAPGARRRRRPAVADAHPRAARPRA